MKNATIKIGMFIGLAIISAVVSANAQNVTRSSAEIPFDFAIGTTNYAAGQYMVIIRDSKVLTIANKSGKSLFNAVVSPNAAMAGTNGTQLMFDRFGDRYFLAGIVSQDFGLKMKRSTDEQNMAENRGLPMKTVSLKTK